MGESNRIELGNVFARRLPELALPWTAAHPEHPRLLILNETLAQELGIDAQNLRGETGVRMLLGNAPPAGATPVAQVYAGHQFGVYMPRLGDGRALLLGEMRLADGSLRDLHLKGSGRTPFSRGGDGFAAVGPMLREYLMGEAMHALGVPTTRALAVVGTGRRVLRDDSLDPLPGAVLARVASSHLRVGSFQYASSLGDPALLRRLVDFSINRHAPSLAESEAPTRALLDTVTAAQAELIASWMLVGFVHGVMNTDNMTISGETIDYGPCAFIDAYSRTAVFSSIDHAGRYSYGNQPQIALWNLTRFAETLLPLLADESRTDIDAAKAVALESLNAFSGRYRAAWLRGMRQKLGLAQDRAPDELVERIADSLLGDLEEHRADYTLAFRALGASARRVIDPAPAEAAERDALEDPFAARLGGAPGPWFAEWLALQPDADAMDAVNPLVIPRNTLVDEALAAATAGDLTPFERLLDAVTQPYATREGLEQYAEAPPPGSRRHITYCGT